jgi:hypothetical protein
MKYWMMALLTLSLMGCATTEVALTGDGKPEAGTLQLTWLEPNRAEIALDGKRYVGEWADSRCFTPQCRGEFFNVPKIHRRHIRKGSAELAAQDDSRLNCEWVSHEVGHDKKLIGTCQASDGRQFKLKRV